MEYNIFAAIVLSISCVYMASAMNQYQPLSPLTNSMQDNSDGANDLEGTSKELESVEGGITDIAISLEKQRAGLEHIKASLEDFARRLAAHAKDYPMVTELSASVVHDAFRQALYSKGMAKEEVDDIIDDVVDRLQSRISRYPKRGWNRFSVQTRFAPFGTKLVPSRKLENGGATLLRYGRSLPTQ